MKKLIALCLTLIMAVMMFAACGGKSGSYEVLVNDASGNPVPGVTIQFCSDTECVMGETDGNGIASFDQEAGSYTVHVLRVPEGYAADSSEYSAPNEPGRVTITLEQEG